LSTFFDPLTDLFAEAPESDRARTIERHALEAQQALLPYALVFFALSLPVLVWAGSFADNAVWMSALFAQFAMNWAAFYVVVSWLRRRPDLAADSPVRTRIHIFGGLLWAAAVAQLAAFSLGAGPAREAILLIAVGAAVVLFFFTCPSLPNLLIVAPAAAVAPLVALYADAQTRPQTPIAWGVVALAMALALMVNRILRRQFAMAAEREILVASRAESLARAERLAKSKSDILATLSHEVRNGLTGVMHVLQAATGSGGRMAPSRDQLSAALGAASDLLDVLNATLDSETAQAGRLQVATEPFNACRLARQLILLYRPEAAAKGVELGFHVDEALERPTAGAAVGDPARVRQILSNLLSNAVKYTARGRVEVRVLQSGPDRLQIEVADTGPGLSAEEIEHAFEPFSRIERTGVGLPGAGLGLSLARELARLMRGDIVCRSAVGVGSRFCLELPFDAAARLAGPDDDVAFAPSSRSLRILVAEDDALNAAMLRAVLEQLGHQVAHAADGRRAYDLAQACDFDLVMLDGRMPGMSGPETIRALRSLKTPVSRAPMIGVTGADAAEAQACIDAGADSVLRKPVSVAAVARALAAVTSAPQRPSEAPAALAI
jgi:signal transduction histidine kinase/CheY-like chemotaxis protein